MVVHRA
jgi:hypothetical protein